MDNNLPTTNLETASSSAMGILFEPLLQFKVQKFDDDSSNPAETFEDMHAQNFPLSEFETLIDVDSATQSAICESLSSADSGMHKDSNECHIEMNCEINTTEITRRLLKNAVDCCNANIIINEELVNSIAQSLAAATYSPMLENSETIDRTIYSLVLAIMMKKETGELKAYAVGQLVTDGIHNSNMIIIVRGYAADNQSRQTITESISQSLLPVYEISI